MSLEKDIEILENLEKLFMMKTVEIIALKDINPEVANHAVTHLIKKNTKFTVPLSVAIKLIKEGYATVPVENINWMKKIIWKEKARVRNDYLVKHEDDFYQRLVVTLYAIKYDKTGLKMEDELRINFKHLIDQLLAGRLTIILSKAASDTKSVHQNTAPEEDLLFRIVRNVVDAWKKKLHINEI